MKKATLIALATLVASSVSSSVEARTTTYVLCYKSGKVAWSEEHYNPHSIQTAYYRCVDEGGLPKIVYF
ncbi:MULTISPECIES: hypothetical protein [Pseudoalteromonas]|uniref:DUF1496 domain-containing protein n=1 Tax=Pseudoalteromonas obscura TaxID=3048491 RepID=A0ABT7EDY3_9GAMM|nr:MULTISPECIES: hypothetical protein [Pseudoalteromonas]MBQ4836530.1 hypothetical protein [Pseudoalteromonas luteoviolacea]MDK2593480.1 hypothetical protein [Pseudoalteromonas sp. P94(2023)]